MFASEQILREVQSLRKRQAVVLDEHLCGFGATIFRGGEPDIRQPTTLDRIDRRLLGGADFQRTLEKLASRSTHRTTPLPGTCARTAL